MWAGGGEDSQQPGQEEELDLTSYRAKYLSGNIYLVFFGNNIIQCRIRLETKLTAQACNVQKLFQKDHGKIKLKDKFILVEKI